LINFSLLVLEKIFKNVQCNFYLFAITFPSRRAIPFIRRHLNPFPQGWFIPILVKIGPVVLEKKIIKWHHPLFYIFVIISPLKRTWPFIWTNLNFLHPKIIWIISLIELAFWFWRRRLLNYPTPFWHFCDYLPFGEDLALYLSKL
jgi:hypothetical protein